MVMFQASSGRLVVAAQDGRRTIPIDKMECTVGREGGDVTISHPSVSKEHARITFQGGKFFVEDLGSSNGTFVDGTRVEGRAAAASQATVTFGTVHCLLVYAEPRKEGAGVEETPAGPLLAHLVGLGKITRVEADRALAEHRDRGRDLGEVLVAEGFLDPADWTEVWRQRQIIRAVAPAAKGKGISPLVWVAIGVVIAAVAFFLTRK
jgi:pSer/pThr/pTyr-binding forkhead associated (FHA) protein